MTKWEGVITVTREVYYNSETKIKMQGWDLQYIAAISQNSQKLKFTFSSHGFPAEQIR